MSELVGGEALVNEISASIIAIFAVIELWIIILNYERVIEFNRATIIQNRIKEAQRTSAEMVLHQASSHIPPEFRFSENINEIIVLLLEDYKEYWLSQFLETRLEYWNKFFAEVEEQYFFPLTFRNFLDKRCKSDFTWYTPWCSSIGSTKILFDEKLQLYDKSGDSQTPTPLCLDMHKLCLAYWVLTQEVEPCPFVVKGFSDKIKEWEIELHLK